MAEQNRKIRSAQTEASFSVYDGTTSMNKKTLEACFLFVSGGKKKQPLLPQTIVFQCLLCQQVVTNEKHGWSCNKLL